MFTLPKHYMITGENPLEIENFLHILTSHMKNGMTLIQLRAKNLSENNYIEIAKNALKQSKKYQSKLILNTSIEICKQLDADGIHLMSGKLMTLSERPLSIDKLVSAACHNEEDLIQAKQVGVDFVTLSPVLPTKTHPEVHPMGWEKFSQLCKKIDIPVYALGGMNKEMLNLALSHGAYGIAGISGFWDVDIRKIVIAKQ